MPAIAGASPERRDRLRKPLPLPPGGAQDRIRGAENLGERRTGNVTTRSAGDAPALGVGMTAPTSDGPFEKTFRLVCRLDDADIDYVRDTAEWIRRFVARALEVHAGVSADEVTPLAVDMSTRGRWRLMRPEIVAEQLALVPPPVTR
jgi:hypothetical protein